ncbi:MAG: hypothetical protein ACLR2G_05220 [Phascolarctobacterium faecium]
MELYGGAEIYGGYGGTGSDRQQRHYQRQADMLPTVLFTAIVSAAGERQYPEYQEHRHYRVQYQEF